MHTQYLQQALLMAESRRGWCAPNPSVGAVIVKNDAVIATGCHWQAGRDHAEVDALRKITPEEARGATLYVTLEPCAHHGRTPPCINAIIQAGISRVFYAVGDPNPKVQGAGAAGLRQAGIEATQLEIPEINDFYASYLFWWQSHRPMITAKIALSLDGKLAGSQGAPAAITGAATRRWTHQQRLRSDAILSTQRTVHFDNPNLNVRLDAEPINKPIYLLDTHCALSPESTVVQTGNPLVIICSDTISDKKQNEWQQRGVRLLPVATRAGHLDLASVVSALGDEGLFDIWLECGARALSEFLNANLIQKLHVCVAPKFLGANATPANFSYRDFALQAKHIEIQQSDVDTIYTMIL